MLALQIPSESTFIRRTYLPAALVVSNSMNMDQINYV